MELDRDACYRAILARDPRFDGLFFIGVSTTGVYCRPVCPARTPGRDRCSFHRTAAEAEKAGFRACFRCRPEVAPAVRSATQDLAARAVAAIEAGALDERSLDDFAASLGVTARHLRRLVEERAGVSPVELAQTARLAVAKRLLHDSTLPVTEVALAAGFGSLRRFHASFRARFGRPPTEVRRLVAPEGEGLRVRLDYRPPLDWHALAEHLAVRAIPGVERVTRGVYERTVRGPAGLVSPPRDTCVIRVRAAEGRNALVAELPLALAPAVQRTARALRRLFDLDARPDVIAGHLGPLARGAPGLRLLGSFDPFETTVRVILGQRISVKAATTVSGRFAAALGERVPGGEEGLGVLFPTPERVAEAREGAIAAAGIPVARAKTIRLVARAFAEEADPLAAIAELPGIGPWTREVLAMRVQGSPDAFPASDLGVLKAMGVDAREAERRAERWRPWRSYAVVHLWRELESAGTRLQKHTSGRSGRESEVEP